MAARIRLRKISSTSKGRYNFRIVVVSRDMPRDSRHIEQLGYYDPSKKPAAIKFLGERYEEWLKKGAKPTSTVATLYKKFKKNSQKT